MLRVVRHYPALLALSAQVGATLLIGLALYLTAQLSPWRPTWLAAGLLQGLLAATLARYLGLSRWWCGLNLLFVPALLLASGAPLPSWVFLGGFPVTAAELEQLWRAGAAVPDGCRYASASACGA